MDIINAHKITQNNDITTVKDLKKFLANIPDDKMVYFGFDKDHLEEANYIIEGNNACVLVTLL